MKWRVERCDHVVLAIVKELKETSVDNQKFLVTAQCETSHIFKGSVSQSFTVEYHRLPKAVPPTLFLFKDIAYIFFLKDDSKPKNYRLWDSYEGAFADRRPFLRELKLVTRVENSFDQMAGKEVNGLKVVARSTKDTIKKDEVAFIHVILQNVSTQELEIYHNNVPYFILFHVMDENGNTIATKYPKKNNIPPIDKSYFMKLESGDYFTTPPFELQEYCSLKTGKYTIYVEYHLPSEYSGQNLGKMGWSGKVMSNKIEITLTD
jgi:hypothetical protein